MGNIKNFQDFNSLNENSNIEDSDKLILDDEKIFKASKNLILSQNGDDYNVLKMTKWKHETYINFAEGVNKFIQANIRVIDKFGKKKTLKVNIHPEMTKSNVYINKPYRVSTFSDGLWLDKKYNDIIDLDLENKDFEDDFETAIAKRDERKAELEREEVLRKLKLDLNYNIRKMKSYKSAKRTFSKYDMEQLFDFMTDLDEKQREYLEGVIEAMNETDIPKTVDDYLSNLSGGKKELFSQLEETFKETEYEVYKNAIEWLRKQFKDNRFMTEEKIKIFAEDYIESQKLKLFFNAEKHLNNLDIKSVEKERFNNTENGFEGRWKINLTDGTTKTFQTQSIIAGGYIQKMHYRYLSRVY